MQERIDYVDVMTDEDVFQAMQDEDPEMRRMGNNRYHVPKTKAKAKRKAQRTARKANRK